MSPDLHYLTAHHHHVTYVHNMYIATSLSSKAKGKMQASQLHPSTALFSNEKKSEELSYVGGIQAYLTLCSLGKHSRVYIILGHVSHTD